jgi:hypothetical protein
MRRIDLIGKRFGRLVVTAYEGDAKWSCTCDCGTRVDVRGERLRGGNTKSCGCLRKIRAIKHGMRGSREYNSWRGMKDRCTNPNHVFYKYYGGRGITICEEWLSFEGFFVDMGTCPPGCSLDRIDPNRNYEPANCRWAPKKLQAQNQRPRKARTVKRRQREQAESLPPPLELPPF